MNTDEVSLTNGGACLWAGLATADGDECEGAAQESHFGDLGS